jgi:hypothetical protein
MPATGTGMGSPAVAEAIRNLAGWTVSLWLTAEPVYGHSGGHGSGNAKMQPGTSGPMRGTVELLEGSPDVFAFHRRAAGGAGPVRSGGLLA